MPYKDPEKAKEHQRKYRQEHRKETNEWNRRSYQKHKEKRLARIRQYKQSPKGKEVNRYSCQKRRAIKLGVNDWTPYSSFLWKLMLESTNGICPKCKKSVRIEKLTMDHIIPLSKGGRHSILNVQPMCGSCNYSKQDKSV